MTMLLIPQHLEDGSANPEWLAARAGRVTASKITDVMAKIKTGEAAARADYRAQLVAERLTGIPQGSTFINDEMRWGTEQEPFGRAEYEMRQGVLVAQVGLIIHPRILMAAASPDGLVGPDGMLEIKCPKTATHLQTLLSKEVPAKYAQNQIQWQMACAEREWCDFASFDPRLPAHLQLFVKRVYRDEARIKEIEAEVERFLEEVAQQVEKLEAA